jgi:hypothetical protein
MPRKTDHRLTIRFTPEERARLQELAGREALSAFVRSKALSEETAARAKPLRRPKSDQRLLAAILGRLSVHPSVAAYKEIAENADEATANASLMARLDAIKELLEDIRAMLMQALGRTP